MLRTLLDILVSLVVLGCTISTGNIFVILIGIAAIVLYFKRRTKKETKHDNPEKATPQKKEVVKKDPDVWVSKSGTSYHRNSICPHVFGNGSKCIKKSKAKKRGLKPCKNCYPYGD